MLAGIRYYTMDVKGRVVIPAHFRRQLGESFVITRAPGGCILALSRRRWVRLARQNASSPEFRAFFLASSWHVTADPVNGRITIPADLREHAGLRHGEDVVLAGLGAALTIATRPVWTARLRQIEQGLLAELDRPAPRLWSDRFQAPAVAM